MRDRRAPSLSSILDSVREQRWLARHRRIRPSDFVLDAGSGGTPDLRANVLCDRFLSDSAERHGMPLVVDRPFVAGDVRRLPFRDGSFDYVILSHVLEHLEDPPAALAELRRVGRRGYIETPSAVFERIYGFPFHRWLVGVEEGVLVLRPKSAALCDPDARAWFEAVLRELGAGGRFWANRRRLGVYSCLEWEGSIPYRLEEAGAGAARWRGDPAGVGARVAASPTLVRGPADGGPLWRLQRQVSRRMRSRSDRPWAAVERLLCCPGCRGELERRDAGTFRCAGCGGSYPVHEERIPLLLLEHRVPAFSVPAAPRPAAVGSPSRG